MPWCIDNVSICLCSVCWNGGEHKTWSAANSQRRRDHLRPQRCRFVSIGLPCSYLAVGFVWGTKHTHPLTALCPGLPRWVGTRKVKPIWILLKQETVSGSGISWAICKSETRSRQTTTPAPHHWVCYRPDALPAAQPTASKHWKHTNNTINLFFNSSQHFANFKA